MNSGQCWPSHSQLLYLLSDSGQWTVSAFRPAQTTLRAEEEDSDGVGWPAAYVALCPNSCPLPVSTNVFLFTRVVVRVSKHSYVLVSVPRKCECMCTLRTCL